MRPYFLLIAFLLISCGNGAKKALSAQDIVDRAIAVSGGELYPKSNIKFDFRDKTYILEREDISRTLKRVTITDSATVTDIRKGNKFQRLVNDLEVQVPDSMAHKYANSINSVHYFAYLPYGLNDTAVNKKLLGVTSIKEQEYYLIQVTFDRENGGDDYDDVYLYWFNKKTFKPDYLAYEFHVDGGGMRFREAYNERYVEGIRFVDYKNYKPEKAISILDIEALFIADELELLSRIELVNIEVDIKNSGSINP